MELAGNDKENNQSMKVFVLIATIGLPVNAISGIGTSFFFLWLRQLITTFIQAA